MELVGGNDVVARAEVLVPVAVRIAVSCVVRRRGATIVLRNTPVD